MSHSPITFTTTIQRGLADTATPVAMYSRIRARFPHSLLLESGDYHRQENSFSYICCGEAAQFSVDSNEISTVFPDGTKEVHSIEQRDAPLLTLQTFIDSFSEQAPTALPSGVINGLFGYTTYDAVQYFEDIRFKNTLTPERAIPLMRYGIYHFIFAINHFNQELYLLQNLFANCAPPCSAEELLRIATVGALPSNAPFHVHGDEASSLTDEQHLEMIARCKAHIARGDVFQIVTSRAFSQEFEGDDFTVYRSLRSINPSPYLFYFDYGSYRIFGSSPEAQIIVKERKATIFPIAGTCKRSGSEKTDLEMIETLQKDPKENAEHVMLVDLARNDLSKHCDGVQVETYREVQLYSHVIHLVSKVSGALFDEKQALEVLADTFPAGTLSGAPKFKAMELIDRYEPCARGFYGGAIGFFGFNGDCLHAIMIRSFLSKEGTLHYQAGAGIVAASIPDNEVAEVRSKLLALKRAIVMAEELTQNNLHRRRGKDSAPDLTPKTHKKNAAIGVRQKKILVVDNYDSFTFNLVHLLKQLGCQQLDVVRNDKIDVAKAAPYDKILFSPGPGIPLEAGRMPELVRCYANSKSLLGVCLGHQCIGEVFGGMLETMASPVHGQAILTTVTDCDELLFRSLPEKFVTGRYHSWIVKRENFPKDLVITAVDDKGMVMALRHQRYAVRGVQFHPESVLTEHGATMLQNWLSE